MIGTALYVTLICLSACSSGGDDEKVEPPVNWNPHFMIDGNVSNELLSGETCNFTDDLNDHSIRIFPDDNLNKEKQSEFMRHEFNFTAEGSIEITSKDSHSVLVNFKGPGTGKLIVYDYTANIRYYINVVVEKVDVKNNITIYQKANDGWYDNNGRFHDGPFLRIKTTDTLSHFGKKGRLEILSFGSDKKEFEPSKEDFGWSTELKSNGNGSYRYDGDLYMGKVNTTSKNVNYWFYKFVYGSTLYEVRKYNGSDKCLWNGEWNK